MIHELRVYHCVPGRLPDLLKRFDTITLKLWEPRGIRQAGFWTVAIGSSNQDLYYMLEWESLAEREQKFGAFMIDPEWVAKRAETERNGPIVASIANAMLQQTSFSSLAHGQSGSGLYELRVYHAVPGRLPDLLKRFDTITLKIWERHGIHQAGFWTVGVGESNQDLYYLLRWDSLADRETKWNAFQADPEWHSKRAETERNGALVARVENAILQPTTFSSVK